MTEISYSGVHQRRVVYLTIILILLITVLILVPKSNEVVNPQNMGFDTGSLVANVKPVLEIQSFSGVVLIILTSALIYTAVLVFFIVIIMHYFNKRYPNGHVLEINKKQVQTDPKKSLKIEHILDRI